MSWNEGGVQMRLDRVEPGDSHGFGAVGLRWQDQGGSWDMPVLLSEALWPMISSPLTEEVYRRLTTWSSKPGLADISSREITPGPSRCLVRNPAAFTVCTAPIPHSLYRALRLRNSEYHVLKGATSLKAITCEYAHETPGGWLHSNMDTSADKSTHL